jgi:hypothetical protein
VARPGWSGLLLAAGLAAQLAPVLLLPVVLTQDGPAHLDGAWVLLHHGDQDAVGAALRANFAIDLSPVPNMLTTLLLAGLLSVVGADTAEKVVLAGFVVLLVAGLRYALRGVDPRAGWLAVAALPMAGGQLVAYGFYNFCWGVALALFVIGLALRRREGWAAGSLVGAGLLLTLTWSTHLLPWVVAVGVLGGLGVGRWTAAVRTGAPPGRAALRHVLPPLLAALPGVVLSGVYLSGGGGDHGPAVGGPNAARVAELLTLYRPLVVGSWWEVPCAVVVAVVLGGLLVVALRGAGSAGDPPHVQRTAAATARADRVVLGWSTVVAVAALLFVPDRLGSEYGFLPARLAWFPPLLLVLFCATRLPGRPALRRAAAGLLVLAATAAALVRLPTQLADERTAAELLSVAGSLPPGSTFVALRFAGHSAALAPLHGAPDPLRHLSGRLAVEARAVDLGLYEAVFPYFQVRSSPDPGLRQVIDPGLDGLDTVPPWVHLQVPGQQVQYVLVVGLDRAEDWVRSARRTAGVLTELRASYVQVAESGPSGYVSVWRLQSSTAG